MVTMPPDGSVRCSVIIPTHNRATLLPRCIASVRSSDLSDAEIIVADAGSTDETPRVISELDPAVNHVRLGVVAPGAARNAGAKLANGQYLAFLDDDDRWLPNGHESLLEALEREPVAAVAFGDATDGSAERGYTRISEAVGRSTLDNLPGQRINQDIRILDRERFYRRLLEPGQPVFLGATIIRRAAFESVGGFAENLPHVEDWDLMLRLARRFQFCLSNTVCAVHEQSAGNASRDLSMMHRNALKCLFRHLQTERGLSVGQRQAIQRLIRGYYQSLGYAAFDRGDLATARKAYRASLKHGGVQVRSAVYYLAASLPAGAVRRLRHIKQRVSSADLSARSMRRSSD